MPVVIQSGKDGNTMTVTKEGRALMNATVQSELEHESVENGAAYNWSTDLVNIASNATVLLVKNTSDTPLHLSSLLINNGSTASEFTLHIPTTEVTVTGATITGTNLNTGSSNVADASAASDETNNSQGNVIGTVWLAIDRHHIFNLDGVILGKNKSIAIDVVETTTEVAATLIAHYED